MNRRDILKGLTATLATPFASETLSTPGTKSLEIKTLPMPEAVKPSALDQVQVMEINKRIAKDLQIAYALTIEAEIGSPLDDQTREVFAQRMQAVMDLYKPCLSRCRVACDDSTNSPMTVNAPGYSAPVVQVWWTIKDIESVVALSWNPGLIMLEDNA